MRRTKRTSKRFDKPTKSLKENEEFIHSLKNDDTNVSYIEVGENQFKKPYWWKKLDEAFNIK